jgi:hypothetical protein
MLKQDKLLMVLPRLVNSSLENDVITRRGKTKIHTLEMGGHVQMAKSDPEAQRKSSLSDCTWLENEYGSFNLEALKFLMHIREPGSSLLFYFYTYSYFFLCFFSSYIYFFFFISFSFFLSFYSFSKFLIFPPL